MTIPIIIIGAGLTGLTAAYYLQQQGVPTILLEARARPGGRILTSRGEGGTPVEMGATWLGTKHTELTGLLRELQLEIFEQQTGGRAIYEVTATAPAQVVPLPPNDQPSYRIAGGSDALVQALVNALPAGSIRYGTVVSAIAVKGDQLTVSTSGGTFTADHVVSTLPPNLLVSSVTVTPALPDGLFRIARQTQTWMGESIKVGLRYARPFWREDGRPGGTIFSNAGPVTEMYDHTSADAQHFALKGFMDGARFRLSREERRDLVLNQLCKYYGEAVNDYLAYEETVWRDEPFTYAPNEGQVLPHQHNGHPLFRELYLGGRLLLAGSETADRFPGYMDGAVRSGRRVANLLAVSGDYHRRGKATRYLS